ncbi:transporter [Edaphobacter albus]|uniref:transporter n=1 Tax=Edaphobacter sp. 4G125 TaxID=2763071 RepID=UPI0016467810|nr:transporter [Edaphobacter sp. 4G125]QNI37791.1 transporter [Edaphobacter sp. 4G125]
MQVNQRMNDALRERDAIIRNLLQRVQELEWRVNGGNFTTSSPRDLISAQPASSSVSAPAAATPHANTLAAATAVVRNSGYDAEERQASQALDQALIVRGGLLLPSGTLELDNTTSYFSSSSDHLTIDGFALLPVLVVGDITSERVRQDLLLPTFTARLGLPHKLQFDTYVPYGYQLNRTVDAENNQTSQSTFGLGDIAFGLSRQLTMEHDRVPDLLANVRFKTTTGIDSFNLNSSQTALGTGFYAVQGNLTAAKSNDPVVFFGNLSYTANLKGTHTIQSTDSNGQPISIPGHFNPGNAIGFQLGSILSLNPETSMTIGWDQRFTQSTTVNGQVVPASYLVEGSLRLGMSYLYAPGRTLDLSFGVGLTPDTPNLQFSVGLPIRRSLWTPKSGVRIFKNSVHE